MTLEELITQAHQAYDDNDSYSEAVSLYHQVIDLGYVDGSIIKFLTFSEQMGLLLYQKQLLARFPENRELKFTLVYLWYRTQFDGLALKLCRELLEDPQLDSMDRIRLQMLLFEDICFTQKTTEFHTTFSQLWHPDRRQKMMQVVAKTMNTPRHLSMLKHLAQNEGLPQDFRNFITNLIVVVEAIKNEGKPTH